jgi:hypothetical protein
MSNREFLAALACGVDVELAAVELESREGNVGAARRFTRQQLMLWNLTEVDGLADRVLLVVSELVTNAILHGRTRPKTETETLGVTLALKRGFALGVMVTDNSYVLPQAKIGASVNAVCGRGLTLVNAESDGWTAAPRCGREGGNGKAVWAFFGCPQQDALPEQMPQSAWSNRSRS